MPSGKDSQEKKIIDCGRYYVGESLTMARKIADYLGVSFPPPPPSGTIEPGAQTLSDWATDLSNEAQNVFDKLTQIHDHLMKF